MANRKNSKGWGIPAWIVEKYQRPQAPVRSREEEYLMDSKGNCYTEALRRFGGTGQGEGGGVSVGDSGEVMFDVLL